jgi:hypothetical protein
MLTKSWKFSLCVILIAGAIGAPTASAASAAQINTAIQNGLAALYGEQQTSGCANSTVTTGCWGYSGYYAAPTGAAVYAFLNAKSNWPAGQVANYNAAVTAGITYLLGAAATATVSTRDDGVNICPGGGTCKAVYWPGEGEQTYSTGLVVGAIADYVAMLGTPGSVATATGPLAGMTWVQIAQGITNMFAVGQGTTADAGYGYYGGWRYYYPSNGDSDMSTTQWAVFAFIYDQAVGAQAPPASTATLLQHWLTIDQVTTAGSTFGGACYQPTNPPSATCAGAGPTFSETGGWLLSATWASMSSSLINNAISWTNSNWTTTSNNTWYGNFGMPYAMLATYKGLSATIGTTSTSGITTLLDPTCTGAGPNGITGATPASACNWYQDYEQFLVVNQCGTQSGCSGTPAGGWYGYGYWTDPLSTAMDVSILAAPSVPVVPVVPSIPVPTSWVLMALGLLTIALWRISAARRVNA